MFDIVMYRGVNTALITTITWEFTGPKMRFPICFVFQNVTLSHISYTYLAEDRATFHANKGKV